MLTIHCQVGKITQEIAYPEYIKYDDKLNELYYNVSNVITLSVLCIILQWNLCYPVYGSSVNQTQEMTALLEL